MDTIFKIEPYTDFEQVVGEIINNLYYARNTVTLIEESVVNEAKDNNLRDTQPSYYLRIKIVGGAAAGQAQHLLDWKSSPSIEGRNHLFLYSGVNLYAAKM
ncbi:hypothetical protein O3G_MSEX007951 [Manduca sexta]|uniref:Uncharacterized protein n=1 Tax=Manduca sexta TaxID=7130 RepID=A0A921Z9P3_MANSE|nr:hypothetical protein O3G_MSEX007951 [Manduca sexta]